MKVQGTATLAAAGNATVIAAPGATVRLHLEKVTVSIKVFAAGASATLDDGTTAIWSVACADGKEGASYSLDLGGYYFALNKALRLVVAGGDATVIATATADEQ